MQSAQVRWIRERKFALYERLLPHVRLIGRSLALENDDAYLDTLDRVVRVAPPGFGLATGRRRRLADLGVLGHVTLSCATLREVLELWMIFSDNAAEPVIFSSSVDHTDTGASWSFTIKPARPMPAVLADFLADELTAAFFVFGHEMTGRSLDGFITELSREGHAEVDYASVLPGEIRFGRPDTRIVGPAAALSLPIVARRDEPLAALVDQLGGDQNELTTLRPTTRGVYEYLMRRLGEAPTLENAAFALNVSARTLVRRLAREQTSFGWVLDQFRRRYAMTLVEHGGLQPKQIAHLVGFGSENGLRKAFKRWNGVPIGAWAADPDTRVHSTGVAPSRDLVQ